jgi:hypothetical protein
MRVGAFDHPAESFERALDETRVAARATPAQAEADGSGGIVFSAGFDLSRPRVEGGAARWGPAVDWTDERAGLGAPRLLRAPAEPEPADIAADVARELGFRSGMTRRALTERWRAFMWRNHPDRQSPQARQRANARVAIANALYDDALRAER